MIRGAAANSKGSNLVYLSRVVTGWIAWLLALKDALRKLPVKVIRNDKLTCSKAERTWSLGDRQNGRDFSDRFARLRSDKCFSSLNSLQK
jgi:hypothetical protein